MKPVEPILSLSREAEIAALLKQADAQLQAGLSTDEAEQSAEAAYRRVLKLDRSNAQALAGLENMAKEYERSARQHLQAGAPQSSLEQIGKGLALAAGRVELLKLRQEAEQRIAELRAKKVEQERQQETQLQAEQSLFQAQSSFQEGLLEISLIHIEQGLVAVPQHQGLLALREQVKARVMEQQHQAEAQQRQQAEARRQAEEAERKKVEQARRQQEAGQSLIQAVELQKNGRYADSLQQIEKGLALIPDHPELTQLRDQIRAQQAAEKKQQAEQTKRDEEVKKLLEQAETQFKAKRLTEPVGNNAEATYRQLLKLDANNVQAQAGLVRIAQDYLQQAQQKKAAGALQDSLKLIEKGLSVIPNQAELMRLQEDVHAQLAVEQQKLEQQRQADKQRQEEKQRQKQRLKQQQEEKQRQEKQKKIEQQSNDKRQLNTYQFSARLCELSFIEMGMA